MWCGGSGVGGLGVGGRGPAFPGGAPPFSYKLKIRGFRVGGGPGVGGVVAAGSTGGIRVRGSDPSLSGVPGFGAEVELNPGGGGVRFTVNEWGGVVDACNEESPWLHGKRGMVSAVRIQSSFRR